jgi:hypothetical protein
MAAGRNRLQAGDLVVLVGWPFKGKYSGRTATLIRPKRWLGQRAWLVDLDGGRISPSRPGTVRTTVTERVMERLPEPLGD